MYLCINNLKQQFKTNEIMETKKFTNVVGTINIKELGEDFMPESTPPLTAPTYYLVARSLKDGKYSHYIYSIGKHKFNPDDDVLMCFDMFGSWRYSMNDSSFMDTPMLLIEF